MIVALIGARSGSKRIKDKNIQQIRKIPLLVYPILTAKIVPEIKRVYVSSDSHEYLWIAKSHGAFTILRPQKYADDFTLDFGWICHASAFLPSDSTIVLLRPTTPERDPKIISHAITTYFNNSKKITSLRSVHEMPESAWKCCEVNNRTLIAKWLSPKYSHLPEQKVPKTYKPNGYVDIFSIDRCYTDELYGKDVFAYITPRVTEIDTPEDLEYVRYQMGKS